MSIQVSAIELWDGERINEGLLILTDDGVETEEGEVYGFGEIARMVGPFSEYE